MSKQNQTDKVANKSDKHTTLIDNRALSVGKYLKDRLNSNATLKMVSAYFTIYGFEAMQEKLEETKQVKFLYGDPSNIQNLDPEQKDTKSFTLVEESELLLNEHLIQKPLAQACKKWFEKDSVEVRGIREKNLLHGKMYNITSSNSNKHTTKDCVVGSSNFTKRGLGVSEKRSNYELNVAVAGDDCDQFENWFDKLWENTKQVKDMKKRVIEELDKLGRDQAPEFIYYKTLYEIFYENLKEQEEADSIVKKIKFDQTDIYRALYPFQWSGVQGILHRLNKYNGCILADSVGLGKTYTALGVIKHYECRGNKVLVLCPKKLDNNWRLYKHSAQHSDNPFINDEFKYTLLSHTDLSRTDKDDNLIGKSGDLDLANIDLDSYDLVVIDESHNFRNDVPGSTPVPNEPTRKKKTRYERLMGDIIKAGRNTQVLMLSATPVNNTLKDLRNQIYLMCSKDNKHLSENLGIQNLEDFFKQIQKKFNDWSETPPEERDKLEKVLGGDYFKLLDEISLARSRKIIDKYPGMKDLNLGFPKETRQKKKNPPTDRDGKVTYKKLYDDIEKFSLALYHPAEYLAQDTKTYKDLEEGNFKQTDRERSLIGMMRMNMLKRLESSAHSFVETLKRTIKKSEDELKKIEKFNNNSDKNNSIASVAEHLNDLIDEEGSEEVAERIEDYTVGKSRINPINYKDMNLKRWRQDIQQDIEELKKIRDRVKVIIDEPGRDEKLGILKNDINAQLGNNPQDKKNNKRKILIFTAFSDTAEYLYEKLEQEIQGKGFNIAKVTGTHCSSNIGGNDFNKILTAFSPGSRAPKKQGEGVFVYDEDQVDVLIATDCISEGQNLQDCDMVLNYDIHWNPVRLIQRCGRIDRIGSLHDEIKIMNYWPTADLELYIKLYKRIRDKSALVDITATGMDNLMDEDDDSKNMIKYENEMRDRQLTEAFNGKLDFSTLQDEEELSFENFSLEYFRAELLEYIADNKEELEQAPYGLYAVTDTQNKRKESAKDDNVSNVPGIIFCLKQKNINENKKEQGAASTSNPVYPYILVYVKQSGEIFYQYTDFKDILTSFANLAKGKIEHDDDLCKKFNEAIDNGKGMKDIENLLSKAQESVREVSVKKNLDALKIGAGRNAKMTKQKDMPQDNNYELVTWLVVD